MADLDGIIPVDVMVVILDIIYRHKKQDYAKYKADIIRKRHELWHAGDRAAYDEFVNSVFVAKFVFFM